MPALTPENVGATGVAPMADPGLTGIMDAKGLKYKLGPSHIVDLCCDQCLDKAMDLEAAHVCAESLWLMV